MTETITRASGGGAGGGLRRLWRSDARRRFTRRKLVRAALLWLLVVFLAAVFGPLFAPDPDVANAAGRLKPPGGGTLLGTDHLGRDLFARLLEGGRVSLRVIGLVTATTLAVGFVLGTLAGYFGGLFDEAVSRLLDMIASIPTLLLAIIIIVAFGPSLFTVVLSLSIGEMPLYGRLFRAGAMSVRRQEYVLGVQALGLSNLRIMLAHVVPNIVIPVLVVAAGNMGRIAIDEAALSFLGAGVQPPAASWGNMIAQGQPFLQYAPWVPMIPGLLLTTVAMAFSFVGDALRDAFDVRDTVTASADTA